MFMPRLAQARGQVHQARRDDAARGVYDFVGREVAGDVTDGHDTPGCQRHVANLVEATCRIDNTAAFYQKFHQSLNRLGSEPDFVQMGIASEREFS